MVEKEASADEAISKRIGKVSGWLKDPYNLTLVGILILALAIRIYFFIITKNQPLWWDEADYMAYAKTLAGFGGDWTVTGAHSSLFPFIVALFFRIGFSEVMIKFILEFIPSIVIVFLAYKIGYIIYDNKKIGLIAAFLIATFWDLLFYSMRFHLEAPSMMLAFFGIYVFWQGYDKKEKIFGKIDPNWAVPLAVLFIILAYAMRRGFFHFGLFLAAYMICTRKIKDLVKDKYNWIGLIILIVLFFLFEKFIFVESITKSSQLYFHTENPLGWIDFMVFSVYFTKLNGGFSPLLYLFWIGLALIIFNLVISLGYIRNTNKKEIRGDLFFFLSILITMAYFVFYQRDIVWGDSRWFYPLLLASIICIARACVAIPLFFKKYNKTIYLIISIIFILLIVYGGYYQYNHSNFIIKYKVSSFEGIKEAGLYLKANSLPTDVIAIIPKPQMAYYAERSVITPANDTNKLEKYTTFDEFMTKLHQQENITYVVVTFSEPNHPEFMRKDYYNNNGQIIAIQIPFMNTTFDFVNQKQQVTPSMNYGDITFDLVTVKEDAFVYRITRNKLY